ncbi:cytochrome P450 1A1-like [Mercenaria mercenaria]|uniref:cytochrome P450 1A1-like n=1 Tax=Mercenaria mercenaria TaxID=6596 RepID=UPI00234F1A88|nr:cytochrome P450 1A1-like [Mercenaria mercenaria]
MYATAVLMVVFVLGLVVLGKRRAKIASSAPGPLGWPVIGNLPQLGRKPHKVLTDLRERYGDVYQIRMGSCPTVVLNGVKTIRQALVKQSEDFAGRPDFYSFKFIANGNSMGFSDYGARWKMHRRIAQNALALCANKKYNPIEEAIVSEAKFLVQNLLKSGERPVDPHNEIYLSVGNIICALCFGKRYRRDDPDFLQLIKNNDEFMAFAGAGNPVDIMPWMRHFTKRSFKQFLMILDTMNNLCLKKQREHLDTYDPAYVRDITDALIKATEETTNAEKVSVGLTDEHIMTTLQELIGAGFDTIASTLQWSILYLMTNPEWQEKVHQEIHTTYGSDKDPDVADLSELPYTEATILETMRHSCIFPFALPHSTTKDTHLNGHFIKEKTLVFVNLWSVSHDPEYFNEPELYNPSRFLDTSGTRVDRSKLDFFLPFGTGKRKCPGEQLAKMELFLFFTILVQKCKFEVVPGEHPVVDSKYGLTLKPLDFNVIVRERNQADQGQEPNLVK